MGALRETHGGGRTDSTGSHLIKGVVALLVLNALLSFENWWPSPAIKPDARLAPEFVLLWVMLLVAVKTWGGLPRRLLVALSLGYLALVVGRYADVTVPGLFGRNINLYWDGRNIPRFLWVSAQNLPIWLQLAIVAGVASFFWGLYRGLRALIAVAAREAAPRALGSRWSLVLTAAAVVLVAANLAGVKATWPVISKPVIPTYLRQADLLATAFSPIRLAQALPASPPFTSDLASLHGADVQLLFVESYGAMTFDNPAAYRALAPSREELARRIAASGRQVVSAFVRASTFGGASDLSHLSLLSGVDLSDPMRHDLLLTTARPTLTRLFHSHGYETLGFYPALNWDWPEKAFYGFDRFYDRRDLDYRGPHFGYWWIPDQVAIAHLEQLAPVRPDSPPRFLFFPTITSHIPFRPVPPYQPDWSRVVTDKPFDDDQVALALADKVDWLDMFPAYVRMIEYNYRWIGGYLSRPAPRDYLLILVGDHQPASSVSGQGASWDVPVHIITSNPELLSRFVAQGFRPGLEPQRPVLGGMHDLTGILLRAFDGPPLAQDALAQARPEGRAR
jgi:hypothetical protein